MVSREEELSDWGGRGGGMSRGERGKVERGRVGVNVSRPAVRMGRIWKEAGEPWRKGIKNMKGILGLKGIS